MEMMINEHETTRLSSPPLAPPPVIVVTAELVSPSENSALRSLIQARLTQWSFYFLVL